ncbi:ATP-dependent zinc protease [Marivirga sp. S37H4]|uniref:ATP-dependent zinc protease n=1 Tax=Marivirga aurantiaca TaxID=2802615 RepID=A0A934X0H4_9BACT|nr:RimK/LysX family protein [Marivirga aurantiaca]MBK6266658.1 ATP-dependent zinc protease [Marivirga aurantiaca]
MSKKKRVIGRTDKVDLPELGLVNVQAKIDTGAYTSAIHCSKIHIDTGKNGEDLLVYTISGSRLGKGMRARKFVTDNFKLKKIRSSNGQVQQRYVIKTKLKLFNKIYTTEFSLSDRSHMKNPILLGRKLLNGRFLVDVAEEDLSFKYKEATIQNKKESE